MYEEGEGVRLYGAAPRRIVVLHGGPGALGGLAPLARRLSRTHGVVEPLLAEPSIAGQLERLQRLTGTHASCPAVVLGWSWGAMLGYLFAAYYPDLVNKLVMVGSAVFDEARAHGILEARLSRMSPDEQREAERLLDEMAESEDRNASMARFGRLVEKADAFFRICGNPRPWTAAAKPSTASGRKPVT